MRIAVLGGGISGLSAAYFLSRSPTVSVSVIEASHRVGGWLQSEIHDGFLFERGCRGFRGKGENGPLALRTVEQLGLVDRVELANSAAQHRYIYMNGKLEHVPTGMFELFGSPLMTNILPSIWHDVMSSRGLNDLEHSDETVESFISRRFSPTIAANLIDPLISGIYAGDISKLSVESVFPSLKRLERLYGSVVRGAIQDAFHKTKSTGGVPVVHSPFVESARLAASVSFSGGMSTFTNALAAAISATRGCEIVMNSTVCFLEPSTDSLVKVTTRDSTGKEVTSEFDHVISAVPSNALARALPANSKRLESARLFLKGVPRASTAVVNVGYRQDVLKSHNGFGYLVPSSQKQDVLGVVWDSRTFPKQGQLTETRLSVMMGGARHPEIVDATPEALTNTALAVLQKHMGITAAPDCVVAGVHVDCIPQPAVGHVQAVKAARAVVENEFNGRLKLIGNSYDGIGAADCVGNAAAYASQLLQSTTG